ncbi:alpha/beta hydrolase [Herbivorax sp. ANBcel31]|uniref:esterase/lipase family protein n=1 Tax=Herbivorax sp. ANBcel31 TaxID=3069754 RepID=UPI0027B5320E|nr:alpha/beta hydrolase [Herbivorax sp. ANBcel31]MDQ2087506.1 alpha/beta hydrolase [Herbivorax sp. ANBcel31]
MFKLSKSKILFALLFLSLIIFANFNFLYNHFVYSVYDKNDLRIHSSFLNFHIHTVASEPSNKVYIKSVVKNSNGEAMPNARVEFTVKEGFGKVIPVSGTTNTFGELISVYTPPESHKIDSKNGLDITIKSTIRGTDIHSSICFKLIPVPIVFVHGYQENSMMFDNMSEFLVSKGYNTLSIDFDSAKGVVSASDELKNFLQHKKLDFFDEGILVNKFTLISHSLGGLVCRHYTSSEHYIKYEDVDKMIFLSVPHSGSHIASIGENYFDDQSMKDLIPDSELFSTIFNNMINKGLNSSIQVGNIYSKYDEVVTKDSANLDKWNIKTDVFSVGENNFTMDNLLSGSILEAPNHKGILNNNRVFERIYEMLNKELDYPSNKNTKLLKPLN